MLAAPKAIRLPRPGWFEASAEVLASADEPPRTALDRAKALARKSATELAAGLGVKSGCLDFVEVRGANASTLNQCLTTVQVDAFVVEEKQLEEKLVPLEGGGGYVQRVRLEARVLDRAGAKSGGFKAEVKLPKERFLDGETVTIAVRATASARFYVLNVTTDGATLLVPNAFFPDSRAPAGSWLHFPDEDARKKGVEVRSR